MGKYQVQEIEAPEGYILSQEVFDANLEYVDSKTPIVKLEIKGVVNEEPRANIIIMKRDSETNTVPQGDASFKNAEFKVYADEEIYNVAKTKKYYSKGDLVATRVTDDSGNTEKVTDLPLGKYMVKETRAPEGYLLDNTEHYINLTYKDQLAKVITESVTVKNNVKKMQVHIYKSGINIQSGKVDGLEGAEFTIKLYEDVEQALKLGYSYEEIWSGIDKNGNKVDVDSKRVEEAQKIAPTYENLVTDKNGDAYSKELPYGKYVCKETKTPLDFYSAEDFTFSITKDKSEIKDVAQKVKNLYVNDEQMESYIKLIKKDKKSGKIVSLNSATFQIKATKDIIDRGNGKILFKKGDIIKQKIGSTIYDSFTTNSQNLIVPNGSYTNANDKNGEVVTPLQLPVGSYEITEIKTPDGFLQLEKNITFSIEGIRDYDKDKEDYILEVVVENEQPTATIIVDKSIALRENVDTSLVDISDLSGIQFRLIAKSDIIDKADGSIIYKANQEVGIYNLNKEGVLKIENLYLGNYELQEIKTIDGLALNDTKYDVKFEQKDTVTKNYTETRKIVNDTTLVEISKTDITNEEELKGAKLSVIDENNNVIDSWISDGKTHKIEGLIYGKSYILREEIAPKEYVKATDVKFTVKDKIQKVKMVDKVVDIVKTDLISEEEVEGAELEVRDMEGNLIDKWVSTKEPHRISNLEENKSYVLTERTCPYRL